MTAYVVHLLEELGRVVERGTVLADGAVELVPLAFHVVRLSSEPPGVAAAVTHHPLRGVREAAHLAVHEVDGALELLERLRRQLDRRQRAAVGAATRVELPM